MEDFGPLFMFGLMKREDGWFSGRVGWVDSPNLPTIPELEATTIDERKG
jgi:hypothetical protein